MQLNFIQVRIFFTYIIVSNLLHVAENYRSCINDCKEALKLKPDYMKAIQRIIEAAKLLDNWKEVMEWCEKGLEVSSDNENFKKIRTTAKLKLVKDSYFCFTFITNSSFANQKQVDAQERKKERERLKKERQDTLLYEALKSREISIGINKDNETHSYKLSNTSVSFSLFD